MQATLKTDDSLEDVRYIFTYYISYVSTRAVIGQFSKPYSPVQPAEI